MGGGLAAAALFSTLAAAAPPASQADLTPLVNPQAKSLEFDWPALRIGTAEYAEGPTGVTVFHFPQRALAVVDARGGGPGTVNTDYLRLGYETPELDAVVFAGGSWYGLENTTAVATALKDDGIRNGNWDNIALSVGAIVYDLGGRRFNEIYPDKRLAHAAYRAAQPGVFPLGAHGAGRNVRTGYLLGCNAYSGQGGAFRQIGDLKLAAFTVVNALGIVTTRDGRAAACYPDAGWPRGLRANELVARYADAAARKPERRNTTISLVVTNRKLKYAELQRLAVQVHTSMARAIQPFATEYDGDVLYAVSTGEVEQKADAAIPTADLGVIASELMWDAVLTSVPEQPSMPERSGAGPREDVLRGYAGDYVFSPFVTIRVSVEGGRLYAQATGKRDAHAIGRDRPTEVQALSARDFTVPGRYPLVLRFDGTGRLIVNPGPWQQIGSRP